MYNSLVFSRFMQFCNHHCYLILEHFHCSQKKSVPISCHSPFSIFLALGNHKSTSSFMDLPILDISCETLKYICAWLISPRIFVCFFIFVVLEIEVKTSQLLGKLSTIWAMPQVLFLFLLVCCSDRVSGSWVNFAPTGLLPDPPISNFWVASITGTTHRTPSFTEHCFDASFMLQHVSVKHSFLWVNI